MRPVSGVFCSIDFSLARWRHRSDSNTTRWKQVNLNEIISK